MDGWSSEENLSSEKSFLHLVVGVIEQLVLPFILSGIKPHMKWESRNPTNYSVLFTFLPPKTNGWNPRN